MSERRSSTAEGTDRLFAAAFRKRKSASMLVFGFSSGLPFAL